MDESVAARTVWHYLEALGCTRAVSTITPYGRTMSCVQIWQGRQLVASGQHAVTGLANSEALLQAMRHLGPTPPRRWTEATHRPPA